MSLFMSLFEALVTKNVTENVTKKVDNAVFQLLTFNILFKIRFRSHFMCEYRLPIGKYRAALRHIDCADGANIDLHKYPLIHRRRDDGPPSPQRLLCNRGKVGVGVVSQRDDGPPLLGGAAPFSSRQKRATFPAIGKVYPTKLGRAERAKVDFTFQLSIFNLLAPLCTLKNSPRGGMK